MSGGRDFLLDCRHDPAVTAIDVHGEETGATGRGRGLVAVHEWPDDLAIGFRKRKPGQLMRMEPVEPAFTDVLGRNLDRAEHSIDEHQPMATPLERLLAYKSDEVETIDRDINPRFFTDLPLRTLRGRLAGLDVQLPSDGGAEAEVGSLVPAEQKDATVGVAKVAQAGDFVGQSRTAHGAEAYPRGADSD